jgi:hypothetical protein
MSSMCCQSDRARIRSKRSGKSVVWIDSIIYPILCDGLKDRAKKS